MHFALVRDSGHGASLRRFLLTYNMDPVKVDN